MSALLRAICRSHLLTSAQAPAATLNRPFGSTSVTLARHVSKIRPASKKKIAARARKKALAARNRNIYAQEKMPLASAIAVLRAVEVASPNATYELTVKTEMKRGTPIPKGRINLPREVKPKVKDRILVFAEGRQAEEARKAGADIVGGLELVDGIVSGRVNATTILSTPGLIRAITPKLGRVLGPRGLMPSDRRGTVTEDIAGYIERLQGSAEWRGDKDGTVRTAIGKLNFPIDDVVKNVRHLINSIKRATGNSKEEAERKQSKNTKPLPTITKVVLSSRQGPGIQVADI